MLLVHTPHTAAAPRRSTRTIIAMTNRNNDWTHESLSDNRKAVGDLCKEKNILMENSDYSRIYKTINFVKEELVVWH